MSQAHEHHEGHGHGDRSPWIQHHYDDAQHQFDSGKLGIWFFLTQELLFFSGLFVAYILYRYQHPEIYAYAHHYLDVKWGAINTAVLIISSLSAAWAVRCAQLGQRRGLILCLAITIVCAFGFLGIKYIEYAHKIHEGILWGPRFDPCVAAGGDHMINKANRCGGVKSSVVWDKSTKAASRGCLLSEWRVANPGDPNAKTADGSIFDFDRGRRGYQARCEVAEVTFRLEGAKQVELGRKSIPPCEPLGAPAPAAGTHAKHATPCWKLQANPWVCPDRGPAALVEYGDHTVRGANVEIAATCELAPPPPAMGADAFADVSHVPATGESTFRAVQKPSKHELQMEYANGPPPAHTNMFFSIYFAMTGLHGIHVLAGIFVFIWLLIRAIKGHFTPDYFGPVDYAALYWHLVDLIWIFLFPLLYLIH